MPQDPTDGHAEQRSSDLRLRAEDAWRQRAMQLPPPAPPDPAQRLVHELQVHQIELEMQNEQLRQTQEELEASRDKYLELYDLAPVGYLTLCDQGLIRGANMTMAALLGVERANLVNLPLTRFIVPEDQDLLHQQRRRLRQTGTRQVCELRLHRRHSPPLWARLEIIVKPHADGGPPLYWATVNDISEIKHVETALLQTENDISELKRAEAALLQTHKLESLGIIAGGIAHDFNNLLVALLGQCGLALKTLPAPTAARSHIEAAIIAAERASDLTRQLLAYSGHGKFLVRSMHLNTLIEENLHLLEVAMPKPIRLQVELAAALPLIQADAGQMQQVVMNLIINAAEAIGDRSGTVHVSTSTWNFRAEDAADWIHGATPLQPGPFVRLSVRDDGCGMDAATLAKMFDPFFSTKPAGRGLGLAALLGIVSGHHGGLHVDSIPGTGTNIQLIFPVAEAAKATLPAPGAPASAVVPLAGTGQGILVIDDEEIVCAVLTDVLEASGYRVFAADSGESGMALYRQHALRIGLVVLDLSMPGQSPVETFRQLRAFNPQVRIALTSGYDATDVALRFDGLSISGFLQKPYHLEELLDAIERYLPRRLAEELDRISSF